ncbi:MAG: RAMP superfamily CRISPR-associated protein, partial [Anaerolineae bacterium]
TAIDLTGVPETGSLRAMRVILRETPFEASLRFTSEPTPHATALLAACVRNTRRVGLGRNRGRGRVEMSLHDGAGEAVTERLLHTFVKEVR